MDQPIRSVQHFCGGMFFKQRKQLPFFLSDMAFQELAELLQQRGNGRGFHMFTLVDHLFNPTVFFEKLTYQWLPFWNMLDDEREERLFFNEEMTGEVLAVELGDKMSAFLVVVRPTFHHAPMGFPQLMSEEETFVVIAGKRDEA